MNPIVAKLAAEAEFSHADMLLMGDTIQRFADLVVDKCCEAVMECDTSEKMILHEPYRTVVSTIVYRLYEVDDE